MLELRDKVRIKDTTELFRGRTGTVTSLLLQKTEYNIGVRIDANYADPTPYYFCEDELEKINTVTS